MITFFQLAGGRYLSTSVRTGWDRMELLGAAVVTVYWERLGGQGRDPRWGLHTGQKSSSTCIQHGSTPGPWEHEGKEKRE